MAKKAAEAKESDKIAKIIRLNIFSFQSRLAKIYEDAIRENVTYYLQEGCDDKLTCAIIKHGFNKVWEHFFPQKWERNTTINDLAITVGELLQIIIDMELSDNPECDGVIFYKDPDVANGETAPVIVHTYLKK